MKRSTTLAHELEDELYGKETGYTTFLQVEPGGAKNGLEYSACGFDVVVLDHDGKSIAYRYGDDAIDTEWQIGDIGDVADAVFSMQASLIEEALTDEMIDIWHAGAAQGEFNDLAKRFGGFEIWGSRTGSEPLSIRGIE